MGCYTWWVTIAIFFTALTALRVNGSPEHPVEQFDVNGSPEHPVEQFDVNGSPEHPVEQFDGTTSTPEITLFDATTSTPEITLFDADDMESDEEEYDKEHLENGREDDTKNGIGNGTESGETLPVRDFMDKNPTVIDGQPVFEGDIAMTASQWRKIRERKALRNMVYRWREASNGFPYVPYVFADNAVNRPAVLAGIRHWTQHTCIKFGQTTNTNQPHLRFLKGNGCWSYAGRLNQNGQGVSIGNGCTILGIVAHEIGHAIGFEHEQSRPDRDYYVTINYANIIRGKESNFVRSSSSKINNYGTPYDYSSVMHYGSYAFSKNGGRTIVAKYWWGQKYMGQRYGLSHWDKLLANRMYGCIGKWLRSCRMSRDPCVRGGYVGAYCRCVCPPGTWGYRCER